MAKKRKLFLLLWNAPEIYQDHKEDFSTNIYLFKFNNRNRKRFEIHSKSTSTSLRSDAENKDVLLILVLRMSERISPEILTSSSQVRNVETLGFTFSQNLSKRARNSKSMHFKTVSF